MPQTASRNDPARNFNFLVEIDNIAEGSFMECTGLDATTEVIEYREGGDNTSVRKLPGKTSYSDITLKRGLTASRVLWEWRAEIIAGTVKRKSGSIVLFDVSNKVEVARWNFIAAWPTKWEGPHLDARAKDVAIETLIIAHEGLSRV